MDKLTLTVELKQRDDGWLYEISAPQLAEFLDDETLLTRGTTPDLQDIVDTFAYDLRGVVKMVTDDWENNV